MILARCGLGELGEYGGKLLSGEEKVFLDIEVNAESAAVAFKELLENKNVYCVTVSGDVDALPDVPNLMGTGKEGRVFYKSFYPDLIVANKDGYTTLYELPENFSDMRYVFDISKKCGGKVRFIGGNLLEIPGVPIGRVDTGKEKMSSVFNGVYDSFLEVGISDIENIEVLKAKVSKRALKDLESASEVKEKKVKSSNKAPKAEKPVKVSFNNLFSGESVDF